MKINVGSENPIKVGAVKEMLAQYDFLQPVELRAVSADSGVADQPKSLEETVRGAINRARNAFDSCDLSFGLESGLISVPNTKNGFMDACVCAIYDGREYHLGMSSAFELPPRVAKLMTDKGLDMSQACNEAGLSDNPKLGSAEGAIGILTRGRMTRMDYTKQAITTAMIHLENADLFGAE